MLNYTELLTNEFDFPNITVYKKLKNGEHYAWHIVANEGYVMYDTAANDVDYDEEGNPFPIIYYYDQAHCPLFYDFTNFTWIAVPSDKQK